MSEAHDDLDERQLRAIALLLGGEHSHREISEMCGIGERQFRTWRNLPAFKRELAARRSELLSGVVIQLLGRSGRAIRALDRALLATGKRQSLSVRAAAIILGSIFKAAELHEFAEELQQLKQQIEEIEQGRGGKA